MSLTVAVGVLTALTALWTADAAPVRAGRRWRDPA
jgi:hypothetical protein